MCKMHLIKQFVLYWKPLVWSLMFLFLLCLSNNFIVLPICGFYLLGYVLIIAIASTWISFVTVQNFLKQNKPIGLTKMLNLHVEHKNTENFEHTTAFKQLIVDIDKYFIEKWFVYISKDPTFSEESRKLLDEVINNLVNVQLKIDHQVVLHGILNVYLKHLKEFRRSLKRKDKYSGRISELYRYSHTCSTSRKAKDYYIHQLTVNLLNHFINWELGNSLPYQILVSIISKKVLLYILHLLSNPEFLNYCILSSCASASTKSDLKLDTYRRVKIIKITEKGDVTPSDLVKSASKSNLTKIEPKVDSPVKTAETDTAPITEIKTDEVKIYEAKSCKTWYDSMDLTSIPLGQDLLDTITLEDDADADEKDILSPIASAKNLLDEVKQMTTLEGLKTSMKPISDATATTFHNIKDLQESTVNSVVKPMSQATSTALHKIGGLHLQDEAAGVVEGFLDFAGTRIRKGLRLTGLQDSPPEEIPKTPHKKHIPKMTHVKSQSQEKLDEVETALISQESEKEITKIPSITTHSNEDGSPEPEYEETADLATSIAKLRSLLEQKSSESNMSTPALSPMPMMSSEEGDETDGVMPSFYKFCAKTATGVIHNTLNTIKTALPGNVAECDRFDGAEKWLFVEANAKENDLFVRMHKLLCERKVFCTVDTAYEAIDSLESQQDKLRHSSIQFDDELDDFEVKLPVTKALLDIFCELLSDTKSTAIQEPVIKSIMLLLGDYLEKSVLEHTEYYLKYCCANAKIPSESNTKTLSLELEEFIQAMLSGIPDYAKCLFGEKTIRDVANLFVSSLQIQKINQDIVLQLFEILCMKLMDGSKQLSPIGA